MPYRYKNTSNNLCLGRAGMTAKEYNSFISPIPNQALEHIYVSNGDKSAWYTGTICRKDNTHPPHLRPHIIIGKENNVIRIRGDWTKQNKQIEQYLNDYNRFAIPFNVMYNEDYPKGIIFSELLKTSEIINAIELMKKNN